VGYFDNEEELSEMRGKTFKRVEVFNNERIEFESEEGENFVMYHMQDCCEHVRVEDIVGDLSDLEGRPLEMAEEVSYSNEDPEGVSSKDEWGHSESWTWTFYKFGTLNGYVTIRWLGESNGYYSESVTITKE